MRVPGSLLLLLIVLVTVAFPRAQHRHDPAERAAATLAPDSEARYWRYSEAAPFHDHLGREAQQFASTDPEETAARVCNELGGDVAHIAPADERKTSLPFLCRFSEPDVTMSVDFGELDRIAAP